MYYEKQFEIPSNRIKQSSMKTPLFVVREKHRHYEQQKLSLVTYQEDLGMRTTQVTQELDLFGITHMQKSDSSVKVSQITIQQSEGNDGQHTVSMILIFCSNSSWDQLHQQRLYRWNKYLIVESNNIHIFLDHSLFAAGIRLET